MNEITRTLLRLDVEHDDLWSVDAKSGEIKVVLPQKKISNKKGGINTQEDIATPSVGQNVLGQKAISQTASDTLVLSEALSRLLFNSDKEVEFQLNTSTTTKRNGGDTDPEKYFFTDWSIAKQLDDSDIIITKVSLPTKHYESEKEIIDALNYQLQSQKRSLNITLELSIIKHCKLKFIANSTDLNIWYRIGMSPVLAEVLGFTRDQLGNGQFLKIEIVEGVELYHVENPTILVDRLIKRSKDPHLANKTYTITSSQEVGVQRVTEALWVHCDIVKPQVVGSELRSLLRIVPSVGKSNVTTELNFNPPHYIPLSLYHINSIRIQIFNTYGLQTIPFESDVIIKLHFRSTNIDPIQ